MNQRFQVNLDLLMSTRLEIIFYVLVNEYNSSQDSKSYKITLSCLSNFL